MSHGPFHQEERIVTTRTFVDTLGRVIQLPDKPQRLVSLVPSITEVLFSFGWGQQVLGITDYCTEPAAEIAGKITIGGTKNPNLVAILALQPQLVFAVAEENRRQDIEQLAAAGVPVYVFEPRTVRDGIDLLWRVAELLDCRAEVAAPVQAIEQEYAETVALVARRQRVRVFCPIWKDPYMTINEETYVHDILRVCGGDNVFARRQRRFPLRADLAPRDAELGREPEVTGGRYEGRDRRYPRITLEEMAALRPDVILLPDEPYAFSATDIADFTPFPEVPAVRDRRIMLIDGKIVTWYGPRIGQNLRTLRQLLLP
jgi:ABC-type Fe3+-hydroxamate transport system substrate-binding protein